MRNSDIFAENFSEKSWSEEFKGPAAVPLLFPLNMLYFIPGCYYLTGPNIT